MKIQIECETTPLMQFKKRAVTGLYALILLLPLASRGGGVVANCSEADLRAAMAGGGLVTFACDGTITLASTVTNAADTVLDATGHQVTISGGNTVRVFFVPSNSTVALKNLKIANGFARKGAGIFNDGGTLTLSGVTMAGNFAVNPAEMNGRFETAEGGAVFNRAGEFNADACTFFSNTVYQASDDFPSTELKSHGGAIRNASGVVTLNGCRFTTNRALGGPTIGPILYSRDGVGGAVHNSGTLTATRCFFQGNSARGEPNSNTTYPAFAGGSGFGGAIYNDGWLALSASTIASNTASGGSGGVGFTGCTDCYPRAPYPGGPGGNGGSANGGGLLNTGSASVLNCTFAGNTCVAGTGGNGGAGGPGRFKGISGTAGGNGGAGGSAFGGGIYGAVGLTNCTLAFNSVISGTGAVGGIGGSAMPPGIPGQPGAPGATGTASGGGIKDGSLINTLLSTNAPGGNGYGALTDLGHNLSSDGSCAFTTVGSLNNTDPKLGPLANNGGPTLTMSLLTGSPAIDTGDDSTAPATDQRGFPRAGLASDIGAVEYGSMLPILSITRSVTNGVEILVWGNAGNSCRLLTSTDLLQWQCVATNQIGPNGTVLFQENCGPGETQRFYRVALP